MFNFTLDFLQIELERKEIIKEMAIYIYQTVTRYISSKEHYSADNSYKLSNAYYCFQKFYKQELNNDEKNIFYLYILFPNDDYFSSLLEKFSYDYVKIGKLFGINNKIIRMRYMLQKNMIDEKEELNKNLKK